MDFSSLFKDNVRNFEICDGIKVKVDNVFVVFINDMGVLRIFMLNIFYK